MAGETVTPNIGLQVPANNQPNWQVPTNFNWNLIDLLLGGQKLIPALDVENLTVQNFTLPNFSALLAASFTPEVPAGATPGTVYTLTTVPSFIFIVTLNGLILRQGIDYNYAGVQITLVNPTSAGDSVYVVYFK